MLHGKKKKKKKKKKKVTATIVASFVKLLFNATSKEREKGNSSVAAVACFVALRCSVAQFHSRVAFFCCAIAQLHSRKKATAAGLFRGVALQCSSATDRRRRRQLPSLSLWSCAAAQLRSRQKKAMAVAVTFFVELRCNAIPE
jgi:hypothetical protein